MLKEYLEKQESGYKPHKREAIFCANDLNTLMKTVEDQAQRILQIRNPNFMAKGKWDIRTDGSHAEIIFAEPYDNEDAVRFIIDEVDYLPM